MLGLAGLLRDQRQARRRPGRARRPLDAWACVVRLNDAGQIAGTDVTASGLIRASVWPRSSFRN